MPFIKPRYRLCKCNKNFTRFNIFEHLSFVLGFCFQRRHKLFLQTTFLLLTLFIIWLGDIILYLSVSNICDETFAEVRNAIFAIYLLIISKQIWFLEKKTTTITENQRKILQHPNFSYSTFTRKSKNMFLVKCPLNRNMDFFNVLQN